MHDLVPGRLFAFSEVFAKRVQIEISVSKQRLPGGTDLRHDRVYPGLVRF